MNYFGVDMAKDGDSTHITIMNANKSIRFDTNDIVVLAKRCTATEEEWFAMIWIFFTVLNEGCIIIEDES